MRRTLTRRQREVLLLKARGKGDREVAHALSISPWTVRNHTQQAFIRLGVGSLREAFVELGWLVVPAA